MNQNNTFQKVIFHNNFTFTKVFLFATRIIKKALQIAL